MVGDCTITPPLPLSPTFPNAGEQYTVGKASGSAVPLGWAVGQTYHFTPLSFAENMAAKVLFGLIIALAARSQLKVESHDRGKNDDGLRLARLPPGRNGGGDGLA